MNPFIVKFITNVAIIVVIRQFPTVSDHMELMIIKVVFTLLLESIIICVDLKWDVIGWVTRWVLNIRGTNQNEEEIPWDPLEPTPGG